MSEFAVILPAAGRSQRFGGRDKLLERLGGKTVLQWAVEAFLGRDDVGEILIATNDERSAREAIKADLRIRFCPGGENRAESVGNALRALGEGMDWVAVHDAARPLVSQALIDRVLKAAHEHGAAVPALAVRPTIKMADSRLPTSIMGTLPRHTLWAVQTPQIAQRGALLESFERCPVPLDEVTDDAQMLELRGYEVWLVEGEENNIKITTPLDLRLAELIVQGGDGQ